ncbi:MAG: ankyrin repeat domain-containing protein [Leptolyngbya sp. SIO1E4]|nr:ankyrin repeat domain-containing protein [Leptolyngbya sp. SIO1E4]
MNDWVDYTSLHPNVSSLPPLHQAAGLGDVSQVHQLLDNVANLNALDPSMGNSPLHIAAQGGSIETVSLLLERGAFLNLQTPTHGVTPLMVAVWHRQVELVSFLLGRPGINLEIRSTFGLTAPELAEFGLSPTDDYAQHQRQQLAQLFENYRQKRAQLIQEQQIFAVLTDETLGQGEKATQVKALIAEGAAVNTVSPIMSSGNDGHTPLLVAARDGLCEIVEMLLKAGADQTISDHYMKAVPLHKAAYMGHAAVIQVLSRFAGYSAVIDLTGPNNGYTPLHDAVWHGHLEAVQVLLETGARIDIRGHDGKTPPDLANEYRYVKIAELLSK